MPRLIALEWDAAEARIAVARVRGGSVELDHAVTVPLPSEAKSPGEIGARIKQALQSLGGGGDALVALGRANIELRFLSVPPVPLDELPDLVKFQAARQFSTPIEEGLIDFSPLMTSGDPPTSVLAAAIAPETLKSVRDTCAAAGLNLKHLALRPFAADALLVGKVAEKACVLTIDRLAEEVDLTVVIGEHAVFPRTVRVASYGTPEEQAASVVAEMRRTIAAAQNQLAGNKVDSVVIFGRSSEQRVLADKIRGDLELPAELVDPLDFVTIADTLRSSLPQNVGRFAPLVGLLVDESRGRRHEIDFLAPRKRPEAPDRRRLYSLAGAAAATIALAVVFWIYWQLSALETQITEMQDEAKKIETALKRSRPAVEKAKTLDEYAAGKVTWLEELREVATELPPADRVIIRRVVADVSQAGPNITLQGQAKESKDIPELESKLRDERHKVSGSGLDQVDDKQYPWAFNERISVVPPGNAKSSGNKSSSKPPPSARRSP